MKEPIITLLTDFGYADHFVGVLHGVISGICPAARVIDISHEVKPFEIGQGAFLLNQAWSYFPKGSVHVAIVDPGVGSARRPILIHCGGHYFIGPDNGVLAMVYSGRTAKARELTNEKYFLRPVSRTFHGRDIFAPVAAHLAKGGKPSRFGPAVQDFLKIASFEPQRTAKSAWSGTILHVDRFGNLVTNFHVDRFAGVQSQPFELAIGPRRVDRIASAYAEAPANELVAIVGSSGYLEISINQGSAAKVSGCAVGAPCDLTLFSNA